MRIKIQYRLIRKRKKTKENENAFVSYNRTRCITIPAGNNKLFLPVQYLPMFYYIG